MCFAVKCYSISSIYSFMKLENYGIEGEVLEWIKMFLFERRQRVCVNGFFSEWTDVVSGIPQGSVLGALLFVIYINDMPEEIESSIYLFADDTKFFRTLHTPDDHEVLQRDLDKLHNWSNDWRLRFHPDKCEVLTLSLSNSRKEQKYEYKLG